MCRERIGLRRRPTVATRHEAGRGLDEEERHDEERDRGEDSRTTLPAGFATGRRWRAEDAHRRGRGTWVVTAARQGETAGGDKGARHLGDRASRRAHVQQDYSATAGATDAAMASVGVPGHRGLSCLGRDEADLTLRADPRRGFPSWRAATWVLAASCISCAGRPYPSPRDDDRARHGLHRRGITTSSRIGDRHRAHLR